VWGDNRHAGQDRGRQQPAEKQRMPARTHM
jgi:hypothetical protein